MHCWGDLHQSSCLSHPTTSLLLSLSKRFSLRTFLNMRLAINYRAVTTTIPDQQSCDYHQTAQLSEFTLATTAYIRRIVLQSSAKSCTLDPIPTHLLKEKIDKIASVFTDIINTSLEYGVVPATMKHETVTPILKKNAASDVTCLANYRPISNLSFQWKTLERYVAKELRYLDINGYNDSFQSAYQPKHSI